MGPRKVSRTPNNQEIKKILNTYISSEEKTNQPGSGRKRTRKYKKSNNKTLKK